MRGEVCTVVGVYEKESIAPSIDRGYHSEVARLHSINGNRNKIFIVTNATGRYDLLALQPSFELFTEFSFLDKINDGFLRKISVRNYFEYLVEHR